MAELDPDQKAALRRLRAAFGFVEILEVVDHEAIQDEVDEEAVEDRTGPLGPLVESAGSCQVPRRGDRELGRDVEATSRRRLPGWPARPSPSTPS